MKNMKECRRARVRCRVATAEPDGSLDLTAEGVEAAAREEPLDQSAEVAPAEDDPMKEALTEEVLAEDMPAVEVSTEDMPTDEPTAKDAQPTEEPAEDAQPTEEPAEDAQPVKAGITEEELAEAVRQAYIRGKNEAIEDRWDGFRRSEEDVDDADCIERLFCRRRSVWG